MSKLLKQIKFIAHYGVYMEGEIASFHTEQADAIINAGFAVEAIKANGDADRLRDLAKTKANNIPKAPETRHLPGPKEEKKKTTTPRKTSRKKSGK